MKSKLRSFQFIFIVFFLMVFILICCQKKDRNVISEKDFVDIYAQFYIINEMNISKKLQLILMNDLLEKYGRTLDDFRYTLDFYNGRPERWLRLVEKIKNKIKESKRKKTENSRKSNRRK